MFHHFSTATMTPEVIQHLGSTWRRWTTLHFIFINVTMFSYIKLKTISVSILKTVFTIDIPNIFLEKLYSNIPMDSIKYSNSKNRCCPSANSGEAPRADRSARSGAVRGEVVVWGAAVGGVDGPVNMGCLRRVLGKHPVYPCLLGIQATSM